ncbi:MAG: cupin domain-containing protein [Methylococcaceae bacterium]
MKVFNKAHRTRQCLFVMLLLLPVISGAVESSTTVHVTELLKTTGSWNGAPLVYPSGIAEVTGMLVEIAPGGETGWHLHQVPSFGVILEGDLQVQLRSGENKVFSAGTAISEVVNTEHNGRNIGQIPVKIAVFYVGVVGKKTTVRDESKP